MVYNGARVALSERGHELASLRVLGFNQREISFMLLGEQGLLALASIPVGFLIGYGFCAVLTAAMQTELYRMPLVINANTYALAVLIVGLACVGTGALLYRRPDPAGPGGRAQNEGMTWLKVDGEKGLFGPLRASVIAVVWVLLRPTPVSVETAKSRARRHARDRR